MTQTPFFTTNHRITNAILQMTVRIPRQSRPHSHVIPIIPRAPATAAAESPLRPQVYPVQPGHRDRPAFRGVPAAPVQWDQPALASPAPQGRRDRKVSQAALAPQVRKALRARKAPRVQQAHPAQQDLWDPRVRRVFRERREPQAQPAPRASLAMSPSAMQNHLYPVHSSTLAKPCSTTEAYFS